MRKITHKQAVISAIQNVSPLMMNSFKKWIGKFDYKWFISRNNWRTEIFYSRKCLKSMKNQLIAYQVKSCIQESWISGCIYLSQLFLIRTMTNFQKAFFRNSWTKLKHVFAWLHMIGSRSVSKRWRARGKFSLKRRC